MGKAPDIQLELWGFLAVRERSDFSISIAERFDRSLERIEQPGGRHQFSHRSDRRRVRLFQLTDSHGAVTQRGGTGSLSGSEERASFRAEQPRLCKGH